MSGFRGFQDIFQRIIDSINTLSIQGLHAEDLNILPGSCLNLKYSRPNGETIKFLRDGKTYLANQIEADDWSPSSQISERFHDFPSGRVSTAKPKTSLLYTPLLNSDVFLRSQRGGSRFKNEKNPPKEWIDKATFSPILFSFVFAFVFCFLKMFVNYSKFFAYFLILIFNFLNTFVNYSLFFMYILTKL